MFTVQEGDAGSSSSASVAWCQSLSVADLSANRIMAELRRVVLLHPVPHLIPRLHRLTSLLLLRQRGFLHHLIIHIILGRLVTFESPFRRNKSTFVYECN